MFIRHSRIFPQIAQMIVCSPAGKLASWLSDQKALYSEQGLSNWVRTGLEDGQEQWHYVLGRVHQNLTMEYCWEDCDSSAYLLLCFSYLGEIHLLSSWESYMSSCLCSVEEMCLHLSSPPNHTPTCSRLGELLSRLFYMHSHLSLFNNHLCMHTHNSAALMHCYCC